MQGPLMLTNGAKCRAVANRRVGSKNCQQIREAWNGYAEVGLRLTSPYVLQILTIGADYGKARLKGGIEASGVDDHVQKMLFAVIGYASLFGESGNALAYDLDIFFDPGLEEHAGQMPSAMNTMIRKRTFR